MSIDIILKHVLDPENKKTIKLVSNSKHFDTTLPSISLGSNITCYTMNFAGNKVLICPDIKDNEVEEINTELHDKLAFKNPVNWQIILLIIGCMIMSFVVFPFLFLLPLFLLYNLQKKKQSLYYKYRKIEKPFRINEMFPAVFGPFYTIFYVFKYRSLLDPQIPFDKNNINIDELLGK